MRDGTRDPFSDHFARDYMSSRDFARIHGVDKQILLRIYGFDMKECRDPSGRGGEKILKPVIYFVEHQDAPMFVNRTQHEYLEYRFGFRYSMNENRPKILHAPLYVIAGWDNIGGRQQVSVQFVDTEYIDHLAPIGKDRAASLGRMLKEKGIKGFDRDGLRNFANHEYQEVAHYLDSVEGLHDLPRLFERIIDAFIGELKAHLGPSDPPPSPDPDPPAPNKPGTLSREEAPIADFSTPEQRKKRAGATIVEKAKTYNTDTDMTSDDIPF